MIENPAKTLGVLKFLSSLGLLILGEPQMDTERAQAVARLSAEHKAFHYYGERAREYAPKPYVAEGICYYKGNERHENNLDAVLSFLRVHEITYMFHSDGNLYLIDPAGKTTEVEDGKFILYRKYYSPLFSDQVIVVGCKAMLREFEIPENADLHPDDFAMAEDEDHESTDLADGPELEE